MQLFSLTTRLLVATLCCACIVAAEAHAADVVVIPLHGRVGIDLNTRDDQQQTIDARFLEAMLKSADEHNPQAIILDIDSTDGDWRLLADMLQQIVDQRASTDCIAYIRNARGPASLLALTCDRIITHPAAQFGGLHSRLPANAQLEIQSLAETSRQPRDVIAAATGTHRELWVGPENAFDLDRKPTIGRSPWERTVERNRPLAWTGQQLLDYGIADAAPSEVNDIERLAQSSLSHLILNEGADRLHTQRSSATRALRRDFERLDIALIELSERLGKSRNLDKSTSSDEFQKAARTLRSDLATVQRYLRPFDRFQRNPNLPIAIPPILPCLTEHIEETVAYVDNLFSDDRRMFARNSARSAMKKLRDRWSACGGDAHSDPPTLRHGFFR